MNFFRPTFFALEAMPVAAAFAQRFKWLVLDPQDHSIGGTCQPKPCQPEDLIRTWQLSNAWAVPTIAKDAGSRPPYLPKEKSVGMWHYLRQKAALEERFHAQDIFVPKVFVLQHKTTGAVNTFITWAACIPQLFPVCDFVAIRRERKRLFRREAVQESVLIRFDALMAGIGGTLEPVAGDVSDLRVLLPAGAQKVKARVDALRLPPFDKMYQGVPMDKFVDEPLS